MDFAKYWVGGAATGYTIERSLRFNSADTSYLNRTTTSAGNRQTWTWSAWIKRTKPGRQGVLFQASAPSTNSLFFDASDTLKFLVGSSSTQFRTSRLFRDTSAWMHLVLAVDTTQATQFDRIKVYINGVKLESSEYETSSAASLNYNYSVNAASSDHRLGGTTYGYSDESLAEVYLIDGQQLEGSDFGEYDDNNVWQPKDASGLTFGTNGFYLDFSDNTSTTTIGQDSSGNNNHFTANNIVLSSPVYALSTTAATSGTVTNGTNNPYWIDFDPVDADLDYDAGTDGMARVHDGNASSTEVYWTGNLGSSGNVKRARFDLRDFPTLTSLRVYGGFQSGYVNYEYRMLDSSKTEIAGTSGTFGAIGWHTLSTAGSPRYLEISCLHSSSNSTRHRLYAIEVNGTVLANGNPGDVDSLIDTPTNYEASSGNNGGNYCILNPLDISGTSTISEGGLEASIAAGASNTVSGNFHVTSGKWYWEASITSTAVTCMIGVADGSQPAAQRQWQYEGWYYYASNGNRYHGNAANTYGSSYGQNDIIGVALDMDAGTLSFYKNGVSQGVAYNTGLSGLPIVPAVNNGGSSSAHTVVLNFGQRPFGFPPGETGGPPSDYKSICTTNLADPAVADGSTVFDTTLYVGNATARSITGLDFAPDLVWIKNRSQGDYQLLTNTVRGATKQLSSSLTNQEATNTEGLTAFNSDGFDIGTHVFYNTNNENYVAWSWDCGSNTSKTFSVKVVSDSGNKYRFDDFGTSAVTLDLEEGSTYVFDQSDSSNSGHPLRFSTTSDGTHNSGTEYTTGVTTTGTPGSAGAKTTIVVAASAPTLYYYCSAHSGMGGQANTNSTAGASNFDGTHQSTVKASSSTGFSISTHSRTTAASISTWGHGLNAAPEFLILKPYNGSYNWFVWHKSMGYRRRIYFNGTGGSNSYSFDVWSSDSTTLGVYGTIISGGGAALDCLTLAWAPIEGYSAFGSFEGTGSGNGPFVFTGFTPKLIMTKDIDSSSNWVVYDTSRDPDNIAGRKLSWNLNNAESTLTAMDILSNGFKMRNANADVNENARTFIWAAWAEHPFSLNGGLAR